MAAHAAALEEVKLNDDDRQPCEVWTRVMGYYRPVSQWNPGKQSEQSDRVLYRETPALVPDACGQLKLGL